MTNHNSWILVRGGGDLASGVILRLHRSGLKVIVSELPEPQAVRRRVSFAEAVYDGTHTIEGVIARLIQQHPSQEAMMQHLQETLAANEIPVIVDPELEATLARLQQHLFRYHGLDRGVEAGGAP